MAACHWGRARLSLDRALSQDQAHSQLDFFSQELPGPGGREGRRMATLAEATAPVFILITNTLHSFNAISTVYTHLPRPEEKCRNCRVSEWGQRSHRLMGHTLTPVSSCCCHIPGEVKSHGHLWSFVHLVRLHRGTAWLTRCEATARDRHHCCLPTASHPARPPRRPRRGLPGCVV